MSTQNIPDVHSIANEKDFDDYMKSTSISEKLFLVHIELEQVPVCKIVNDALLAIGRDEEFHQQVAICRLNADHFMDFLSAQNVTSTPTVLFYYRTKLIDRVTGFNQNELIQKLKLHLRQIDRIPKKIQAKSDADIDIEKRIKQLLKSSPVILFMKGTPTDPQCGFSRQACHLLDEHRIQFDYFDVFSDSILREQLKKYSNWNTYPQLYVDGELIGGLDIMKQMIENGEFQIKSEEKMKKYLQSLINQAPLMLFIVGTPEAPQCKFTKELFQLFNQVQIKNYQTFNILQDEEVQEKLKEYSSWPTYPQVYLNGQLIGGLDILKQMNDEGVLVQTLTGKHGVPV